MKTEKKRNHPELTNGQRRQVVEMYLNEHKGVSTIARILKVGHTKVENLLKEKKILRSLKEGHRARSVRRAKEKIL